MIITNCVVTNSDAEVVKEYVDSDRSALYKVYKGYHTGVDLKSSNVYSMCPGVVSIVNTMPDSKLLSVVIQFDATNCIIYSNIVNSMVDVGQIVSTYQQIGTCKDFVHFEYANTVPSRWPVRVGAQTFFKHDPTQLLIYGYDSIISYPGAVLSNRQTYDVVLY